jgi:dTDP-4-dehydrorhamnose reductase
VAGASGKGGNFVETMLRLARDGKPLRVVDDQVLGPTSTADLAVAMLAVARAGAFGTVHITNAGAISWHDFAALALRLSNIPADLTPVSSAEYGAPARRPACSVLANTRLAQLGIPQPRPIAAALRAYLAEKGHLGT